MIIFTNNSDFKCTTDYFYTEKGFTTLAYDKSQRHLLEALTPSAEIESEVDPWIEMRRSRWRRYTAHASVDGMASAIGGERDRERIWEFKEQPVFS